jgi:hypothetical protein
MSRPGWTLVVLSLVCAATAQAADVVPGQIGLGGADDVKSVCGELKVPRAPAAGEIYMVTVPAQGFTFAPYDGKRARLMVDTRLPLRGQGFELALVPPAKGSAFELAMPATPAEAARLAKDAGSGVLALRVWFRPAPLRARTNQRCMDVFDAGGGRQRMGGVALAFTLLRGSEELGGGDSAEIATLRASVAPTSGSGAVEVGAAVLADDDGNAPASISRAARAQLGALKACASSSPAGTLVVGLATDKAGNVLEAKVQLDGVGDAQLAQCTLSALRSARFPKLALRFSVPVAYR